MPDACLLGDSFHDPPDVVAVQDAVPVGEEAAVMADVFDVVGGPGGEESDELGVQWDVAVVAELADRNPQPSGRRR